MRQAKHAQGPYEKDFYLWAKTQAELLKKGEFARVDMNHVIEEIEDLAKRERKALKNQTIRLLMHKLKLQYQPEKQVNSNSWKRSIVNARIEIEQILEENPSLKKEFSKIVEESYPYARKKASSETNLNIKTFPEDCPWSLKKIMED